MNEERFSASLYQHHREDGYKQFPDLETAVLETWEGDAILMMTGDDVVVIEEELSGSKLAAMVGHEIFWPVGADPIPTSNVEELVLEYYKLGIVWEYMLGPYEGQRTPSSLVDLESRIQSRCKEIEKELGL